MSTEMTTLGNQEIPIIKTMGRDDSFADRYVDALLKHFGHEETFDVDLRDTVQCDEVAEAFSHRHCTTVRFKNKCRLTVRTSKQIPVPNNAQDDGNEIPNSDRTAA